MKTRGERREQKNDKRRFAMVVTGRKARVWQSEIIRRAVKVRKD